MKKFLILFLLPFLCFVSCKKTADASEIISNCRALSLSFSDVTFTAEISEGKIIFKPDNIGITFEYSEGKIVSRCGKYERELKKTDLPLPYALFESLSLIKKVKPAKEKGLLSYSLDETALLVYYDVDSGVPYRLTAKNNKKEFTLDVISVDR